MADAAPDALVGGFVLSVIGTVTTPAVRDVTSVIPSPFPAYSKSNCSNPNRMNSLRRQREVSPNFIRAMALAKASTATAGRKKIQCQH
jgi:hypothetical protein